MPTIQPEHDRVPTWGLLTRWGASLFVVWHVGAVLVGPLAFPESIVGSTIRQLVYRPYTDALFLNHAYKFFAPDPGPSHLIRYELEFADGSKREGTEPDLKAEQPRLFYHRHFMLTERVGSSMPDADTPPNLEWTQRPPSRFEAALARSFAEHLLHKFQARRVTITLVQHLPASPRQVQEGIPLDHPDSYRTRHLLTLDASQL